MPPFRLLDRSRLTSTLALLALCMALRALLGLVHPHFGLLETVVLALTTLVLAGPSIARWSGRPSRIRPDRRGHYLALSTLTSGLFLYVFANLG
jgi:hypothetical protein